MRSVLYCFISFNLVLLNQGSSETTITGYYIHNQVLNRQNRDALLVQKERDIIYQDNRGQRLKEKVRKLVEWCINEGDDGLLNLRDRDDHFMTFVDVCLVHMTDSSSWSMVTDKRISNVFSSSDEAIAMLVFENHVDDFFRIVSSTKKICRKESKPKYTKENKENERKTKGGFKGWHVDGVSRFNQLMKEVKRRRNNDASVQLEKKIMNEYQIFCNESCDDYNKSSGGYNEGMDSMEDIDWNKYLVEADVDNWASV